MPRQRGHVNEKTPGDAIAVALEQGTVVGFADARVEAEQVRLKGLGTDPEWRHLKVAFHLLEAVRALAPELPVSADVLLGCEPVEGYLEAQGFAPGEVLESDLFGELTVARRWWLPPA